MASVMGPQRPFWHISNAHLGTYAQPVPGGSPHMRLYTTPDPSGTFSWMFAHKEKAKAAVHIIPLVKNAQGEEFVRFIVQTSPIMGGRPILQLPAGTWGDEDLAESIAKAAGRELNEETGHTVKGVRLLTSQLFATSPGITTEMKGMALAFATGEANGNNRTASERKSIIDSFLVPVSTLTRYDRFMAWLDEMNQRYTVGMDVLAARALLPPTKAGRSINALA